MGTYSGRPTPHLALRRQHTERIARSLLVLIQTIQAYAVELYLRAPCLSIGLNSQVSLARSLGIGLYRNIGLSQYARLLLVSTIDVRCVTGSAIVIDNATAETRMFGPSVSELERSRSSLTELVEVMGPTAWPSNACPTRLIALAVRLDRRPS